MKTALLMALASSAVLAQAGRQGFVLDSSKPYVYLLFDHVGPRKPVQEGEPSTGLWLRVVANCRVSIRIGTFGITTGDPGIGVLDEVVSENTGGVRVEAEGRTVPTGAIEAQPDAAKPKPGKPTAVPQGYSAEVHSTTMIAQGENVLFSVPINHVGGSWFMRVRFTLDVSRPEAGNGPYSYVDFYESQIPPKFRVK